MRGMVKASSIGEKSSTRTATVAPKMAMSQ